MYSRTRRLSHDGCDAAGSARLRPRYVDRALRAAAAPRCAALAFRPTDPLAISPAPISRTRGADVHALIIGTSFFLSRDKRRATVRFIVRFLRSQNCRLFPKEEPPGDFVIVNGGQPLYRAEEIVRFVQISFLYHEFVNLIGHKYGANSHNSFSPVIIRRLSNT